MNCTGGYQERINPVKSTTRTTKLKLKEKKEPEPTIFTTNNLLYFSEICLTDNTHFADFYSNILFDKSNPKTFKPFKFQHKDMKFELGEEVIPKEKENFFTFYDDFVVDKLYVKHFNTPTLKYYRLKSFLGEVADRKIALVDGNKLIGVIMLHRKER